MSSPFVGRFLLRRPLGSGGMGRVYLARDLARGTECAIKQLDGNASPEFAELLRREFQALAHVRHPVIVDVRELGFAPDGRPFLVTEYVPGVHADQALDPRDLGAVLWCMARVADGLEALHTAGVVHGDIKPANILVVADGSTGEPIDVRLVDFGLATVLGHMSGSRGGTMGYSAPEVGSAPPAASADLYAFGATLHALLTGELPFAPTSSTRHPASPAEQAPPAAPLERAGLPRDLVSLILRLMAPRPEQRPASAREVRRELERIHPRARRPLADRLRAATCIGRERELGLIRAEAARADGVAGRGGGTRVLLVTGREAAGKSTLLAEAGARLRLEGRIVHAISPYDGQPPWRALAARLQLSVPVDADLERHAQALASPSPDAPSPILLVDDADRYAEPERRWLRALMLHVPPPRVLWVQAMRDATDDAALFATAGFARALPLEPLSVAEVTRLASARLGEPVAPGIGAMLAAHTGGWPGEIVNALQRAARRGAIRDTDAGLIVDGERLAEEDAGDATLPERLAALSPAARHALLVIAACGGACEAGVLEACGIAPGESLLAELADRDLARAEHGAWRLNGATGSTALFEAASEDEARAASRAALRHAGLAPAHRFELQARLGERDAALAAAEEVMRLTPSRAFAEQVAGFLATDPPEAARWWLRAAEIAREAGRFDRAGNAYARVLALAGDREMRDRAHNGRVASLLFGGRLDDLGDAIEAALREPLAGGMRARVLVNDAARLQRLQQVDPARARAAEALALAERAADPLALAIAHRTLAALEQWAGNLDDASRAARAAVDAALLARSPIQEARSRITLSRIQVAQGDFSGAEHGLTGVLEVLNAHPSSLAREEALILRSVMRSELGEWGSAHADLEAALRLALADDRQDGVASIMPSMAILEAFSGRLAAARRHARAAWQLSVRHSPALRSEAARARATVLRLLGDLERAERWARAAVRLSIGRWPLDYERWARSELARVLLLRRQPREALEASIAADAHGPASPAAIVLRLAAADAHLALGNPEAAEHAAAAAAQSLADSAWAYGLAALDRLQARLALVRGEGSLAQSTGERAIERFRALPAPGDAAMTALELCEDALQRGLESQLPVEKLLDQAIERFELLGDRRGRARANDALIEALRRRERRGGGAADATDLIKQIRSLLGSMSNVEVISHRALEMAARHFRAERGVLLLREEESDQLMVVARVGDVDASALRSAHGYSRRVVDRVQESRVSVVIDDTRNHLEWASQSIMDMGVRRVACAPLLVGYRCVGALYLDSRRVSGAFDEHDRHILDELARLLGVAIQGARAQLAVQHQVEELSDENRSLRKALTKQHRIEGFVADSPAMQEVLAQIETASRNDLTVLLTGESGTGKEELSRQIHLQSRRRKGPFLTLNCGSVPAELLASELFGILEGVATGVKHRRGKFELADGGTLFLDEIGDMPRDQQVALLRVLQTREVTPVGGHRPVVVDVRIVAATNRELLEMTRAKEFREDLYYRLAVFPVHVPPLRERKQDIPAMVRQFMARAAEQVNRPEAPRLSRDFLPTVLESDWPGNVRELQNYVERSLAMSEDGTLRPHPLPADLQAGPGERAAPRARLRPLSDAVREVEEVLIEQALRVTNGNQVRAAQLLKITEQSLRYRLRKYGITGNPRGVPSG